MKKQKVERDENGYWTHSEMMFWDEGTTRDEVDRWFLSKGLIHHAVWFESDAPEDVQSKYFEKGDPNISGWFPTVNIEDAFLVSIHDTEDGPVAIFAQPIT